MGCLERVIRENIVGYEVTIDKSLFQVFVTDSRQVCENTVIPAPDLGRGQAVAGIEAEREMHPIA